MCARFELEMRVLLVVLGTSFKIGIKSKQGAVRLQISSTADDLRRQAAGLE